ncbi:PhzF family phenazine biosynthesis protein [Sulfitobacter delicatus]|uniref:Phenazine biosynthesis protein PhzF family n=1 Tax=Sulfitobacter delicatus TaxID=218672 RepID=A0A1G7KG79_9RHOB|nr:PhzF family phenazine biosynthesis protein [Sulfitobacter delicatus]SDF36071.1 phenazine biosynthesis protein PhzF family [Sulfitobacter delicatus]
MEIHRIAAFSVGGAGGNPAGVVLLEAPAPEVEMQKVAAEVGYSETAFALPIAGEDRRWRVRYFSPEAEVPFCGHATIALGAVLGQQKGTGTYTLDLNNASITVEAKASEEGMAATLASPATKSRAIADGEATDALALFGLSQGDLDPRLPPAHIHAGADHLVFALHDRARLAEMSYDLDKGRAMMRQHGLVTIMLVHIETDQVFAVRNAFASGGVLEDPATGAAAAAFAGYLRDQEWPHGGSFTIRQGEDMGALSIIEVRLSDKPGSPVHISGNARTI